MKMLFCFALVALVVTGVVMPSPGARSPETDAVTIGSVDVRQPTATPTRRPNLEVELGKAPRLVAQLGHCGSIRCTLKAVRGPEPEMVSREIIQTGLDRAENWARTRSSADRKIGLEGRRWRPERANY
jgi:hypothetical protein